VAEYRGGARSAAVGAALVLLLGATCAPVAEAAATAPKGPTESGYVVSRVVDGDTVHVERDGVDLTVRLVGVNAPESVKPNAPVECFGPQASDFAKAQLTGRAVRLEFDPSQGRTDQYGRTLAYLWVERPGTTPTLFNRTAVRQGYAFERQYGPTPPAWKAELRAAQKAAQKHRAGLWRACR
jgi:micrococcal nuclease